MFNFSVLEKKKTLKKNSGQISRKVNEGNEIKKLLTYLNR